MTRKPAWPRVLAAVALPCPAMLGHAEDPPAPKVEVLRPATGAVLTGTMPVSVRLCIDPPPALEPERGACRGKPCTRPALKLYWQSRHHASGSTTGSFGSALGTGDLLDHQHS